MAQNFGKIPSHKSYVLSLYRTVLRNIPKCCHSYAFQYEIKKTLSKQLFKHKHDKSSWSVYTLLNEFSLLNNCLLEGKLQEIKNLMKPLKKMKKQLETTKILNSLTSLGDVKTNDPEEVRRFHVLSAYIKRKQDLGLLPAYIPKTYQHKLLLPLALNEHACLKLFHIQQKLKMAHLLLGCHIQKKEGIKYGLFGHQLTRADNNRKAGNIDTKRKEGFSEKYR